jgi:thioredoxin-related protein
MENPRFSITRRTCPGWSAPRAPLRATANVRRFGRTARVMALIAVLLSWASVGGSSTVRFRGLADGMQEAETTGRPVLLFFTAAWCAPCQQLRIEVFSVGGYATFIEERFVPIEVVDRRHEDGANTPDTQALLDRFGVAGFPTIVIIDLNGPAALRHSGFKSREATFSFLRDAPARLEAAKKRARSAR